MELKKTQMQVLKVLVENKNKFLSKRDIHNLSKVNNNHIDNAIKKNPISRVLLTNLFYFYKFSSYTSIPSGVTFIFPSILGA